MQDKHALLNVHGLTKQFGGLTAVDKVDFQLREGEILGLIGPNGSGKTTLLNLLSAALPATAGRVEFKGARLSGRKAHSIVKRGLSRTFQLVRILPGLTVEENVAVACMFGTVRAGVARSHAMARELLQRVEYQGRLDVYADKLTYIDQKKLELARALATQPKVLLLDEWLAGLNPTELNDGISLVQGINEQGTTVILVEHVMHAVRSLCHRVIVLNAGALIADGTPEEVLQDPAVVEAYLGGADA